MPHITLILLKYKYGIIFPLTVLEGAGVMIICGFLVKLGFLSLVPVYICLVIADLVGDIGWYYIGYFFGPRFIKRFGKYISVTNESIVSVKQIFHRHKRPILFFSKITGGFGFSLATLIAAGMMEIPIGSYIILNFFGELVWVAITMAMGYFFGNLYAQASDISGKLMMVFIGAIVIACFIGGMKYIKNKSREIL